jgi:hypothetical protein
MGSAQLAYFAAIYQHRRGAVWARKNVRYLSPSTAVRVGPASVAEQERIVVIRAAAASKAGSS